MPVVRRRLASALLVLALAVTPAAARSEKTLGYARDQVWPTSVRFLVVDEKAKVLDKDADAGYLLFEVKDEGKTFRGSLELASVTVDGRTSVRFVLQLDDRPSWLEVAMLQRLERKLRSELGAPPNAKQPPPPPPKTEDKPKPDKPDKPDDDGGPRISPTP
jgi:hypothetical protein